MSSTDMRGYIKQLKEKFPDSFIEVSDTLDSNLEVPELLWKAEKGEIPSIQERYPVVLFNSVVNPKEDISKFPVISNLFAKRERCALALDTTPEKVHMVYRELEKNPEEPRKVSENKAPVKQVEKKEKEVDLRDFPIIKHHSGDSEPYISAGINIVKSPKSENWGYNAAFQRLELRGKNELRTILLKRKHCHAYNDKYEELGEDMPIVIAIGHHPSFHLGSQTLKPIDTDEYKTIGGVMKGEFRITPSSTWGDEFWVPADAEIIIEGYVKAGERVSEGPFGEYPRYYGPEKDDRNLIEIKAISHRKEPIFHDIFAGHRDHHIVGGIPIEGRVLERIKDVNGSVENAHMPPSGNMRHHCYVSIDKKRPGEGKDAIIAALSTYDIIKHVIVVDKDVDIFNEDEVLWALATRAQLSEDLVLIKDTATVTLDPSSTDYKLSDRGGIDATKPMEGGKKFPERLEPSNIELDINLSSLDKEGEANEEVPDKD